jgi:hypothetical protein
LIKHGIVRPAKVSRLALWNAAFFLIAVVLVVGKF